MGPLRGTTPPDPARPCDPATAPIRRPRPTSSDPFFCFVITAAYIPHQRRRRTHHPGLLLRSRSPFLAGLGAAPVVGRCLCVSVWWTLRPILRGAVWRVREKQSRDPEAGV
eukprot:TRINITY_DN50636_c0_g1_i1.p3 TRINITY_DN50636_c0_g1~~TRINITY_DN50636_c0_g1_i1.p3  ORF type:complete len:111 (-),score=9.30 TRINITY_DN50636_c0_g1_i1:92-424(-)